jgi:hypothetical protein
MTRRYRRYRPGATGAEPRRQAVTAFPSASVRKYQYELGQAKGTAPPTSVSFATAGVGLPVQR